MAEILKVKNQAILEALQNHEEGEVCFLEDTKQYMMYKDGIWMPIQANMTSEGLQINLYELNKQIVSQLPAFEDSQWEGAKKVFEDWSKFRYNEYFMLYGREISYFTIFKRISKNGEFESLFEALKTCLEHIGTVHGFDIVNDNSALEIWVNTNGEMTCLYLFEYDEGVVTFNG